MVLRSCPVSSFGLAEAAFREQVSFRELIVNEPERTGIYRDVCRIAADAFCRAPGRPVIVDGEETTFGYLQEIFRQLETEHVQGAVDALERYRDEIRHKKAFIRTVLYNRFFEDEVEAVNRYEIRYE